MFSVNHQSRPSIASSSLSDFNSVSVDAHHIIDATKQID